MTTVTPRTRSRWFAPTLHGYRGRWAGRDIWAGLLAGSVVIPQAMAYATIAGLPVEVGIATCIPPMLVYALLGGSRALSVSTTSTIAALTATTLVSAGVAADSDAVVGELAALTLIVGTVIVIARVVRLGAIADVFGDATLTGIRFAVAVVVVLGQLPRLLGAEAGAAETNLTGAGFAPALDAAVAAFPRLELPTTVLSLGVLITLLFLGRIAPRFPAILFVVAASIVLVMFGVDPAGMGIALVEPADDALRLTIPSLGSVIELLPGAFAIAIMALLESATVARAIRRGDEEQLDGDRELLALGAAGVAGAFAGALPAGGGTSQSVYTRRVGARSQLAGVVVALLAIGVGLFGGPLLARLPEATLAAIVVASVLPLLGPRALVRLYRLSRPDFWAAVVTVAVGLAAGLPLAVGVGVLLTLALVLRELGRPRTTVIRSTPQELAVRLETPLTTAHVVETLRFVDRESEAAGRPSIVVIELPAQRRFSITVLDALAEFETGLHAASVALWIVGLPDAALESARKTEWFRTMEAEGRAPASIEG